MKSFLKLEPSQEEFELHLVCDSIKEYQKIERFLSETPFDELFSQKTGMIGGFTAHVQQRKDLLNDLERPEYAVKSLKQLPLDLTFKCECLFIERRDIYDMLISSPDNTCILSGIGVYDDDGDIIKLCLTHSRIPSVNVASKIIPNVLLNTYFDKNLEINERLVERDFIKINNGTAIDSLMSAMIYTDLPEEFIIKYFNHYEIRTLLELGYLSIDVLLKNMSSFITQIIASETDEELDEQLELVKDISEKVDITDFRFSGLLFETLYGIRKPILEHEELHAVSARIMHNIDTFAELWVASFPDVMTKHSSRFEKYLFGSARKLHDALNK